MGKPVVYIDGKEGTTGLQIYERLAARDDIELLLIDESKRKDTEERRKLMNASDIVFLCLPDAAAVEAVSANLRGDLTLKEAKVLLAEARKAAQEETDPVRQAAARAVSTACGTLTTPTNALGFAFYGAAAWAYHTAGTEAAREERDRLAQEELERILTSLRRAAVPDEADPVNVNWNC